MMTTLAHDVEHAVASGDEMTRHTMLRRMTDLFVDNAERLGDDQVSAFDTVILELAQSVGSAARAALSESIAGIANAPCAVVRDLVFDAEVAVAGPVLSRSGQVAEGDLLRIAEECGQAHLYALARRRSLSVRLTDVLVARGDSQVLRAVAGKEGARFSSQGFDALAIRAAADDPLHDALSQRRDLPTQHRTHLVETAKARVSRGVSAEGASMAAMPAARAVTGRALSMEAAAMAVDAWLRSKGTEQPEETDLMAWLAEGRVMEALVGLARAAGLPPDMVLRAYQGAYSDPLLFLIRSLRFGWGTFTAFLQSKAEKDPTPEQLRGAFEAFQALPVTTAQRVVRFTAARDPLQKAG